MIQHGVLWTCSSGQPWKTVLASFLPVFQLCVSRDCGFSLDDRIAKDSQGPLLGHFFSGKSMSRSSKNKDNHPQSQPAARARFNRLHDHPNPEVAPYSVPEGSEEAWRSSDLTESTELASFKTRPTRNLGLDSRSEISSLQWDKP